MKSERKEKKVFDNMVYAAEMMVKIPKRHRLCPVVRIVLMPESINA